MAFNDIEISNYGGDLVLLYEFKLGTTVWRYAASESDITVVIAGQPYTYTAIPISDGGLIQSGDSQADNFVVTIASTAAFLDLFAGTPPSQEVMVTKRRKHVQDAEAPIAWMGLIQYVNQKDAAHWEITCQTFLATLARQGLRLTYQRACPHALYDINCTVNPALHATTVQVTALTGNTATCAGLSAFADGYLDGGYLEFPISAGATERRGIETHVGDVVTLLGTTDSMSVGQWITVYPGCNRVSSTCLTKFNNLSNYGGHPYLPTKSPFGGDPIF